MTTLGRGQKLTRRVELGLDAFAQHLASLLPGLKVLAAVVTLVPESVGAREHRLADAGDLESADRSVPIVDLVPDGDRFDGLLLVGHVISLYSMPGVRRSCGWQCQCRHRPRLACTEPLRIRQAR